MIDSAFLLKDLQKLLRRLEDDLRERLTEYPELDREVRAEYDRARGLGRTGQAYSTWRDEYLTQVGVHWILGAVFVRFLEDNGFLPEPWLSGSGLQLNLARDRNQAFFAANPSATDRDYLLAAFAEVQRHPVTAALFDERHNPIYRLGPSADGARALIELLRKIDPTSGALVHDFTDPARGTRFLGDLYQDLSESARKRFALLQTPEFVEEFILDRTLTPAIQEFGYSEVRLIDPACGSGHFLLGAFTRLLAIWQREDPGRNERDQVRKALDQVYGVDLNPFAVAIARFRLLVAALGASCITRLRDAPDFKMNLAAGDSLLHGPRPGDIVSHQRFLLGADPISHVYETEDAEELRRILGQPYHVVVGNPPYITPKDAALKDAYRQRFGSCRGKYSLAVPFTERFFDLAISPLPGQTSPAGWIGMITANSFMKREFGKALVETYIPRWDLTHVINTDGAYIPGHGTPTVILLGRHRSPVTTTVRTVMGIRGEPAAPTDPAKGLVWTAILEQVDRPGSESNFVTVADLPRDRFHHHPWSLGGGGASELKARIESEGESSISEVGFVGLYQDTHADEAFVQPRTFAGRHAISAFFKPHVRGEGVRDWSFNSDEEILFPFDENLSLLPEFGREPKFSWFWALRTTLWDRSLFGGGTYRSEGRPWYDYHQFPRDRARTRLSIALAFVATHNHFVLDRGGTVFNRSAPVIKLSEGASEEQHLELLGLLNSSAGGFWMRQVFYPKGGDHVGQQGARVRKTFWEERFEYDGTKLLQFPIPKDKPLQLTARLGELARKRASCSPSAWVLASLPIARLVAREVARTDVQNPLVQEQLIAQLSLVRAREAELEQRMIGLQEELDWQVYRFYGLFDESLEHDPETVPKISLGERAFEILLARKIAAGEVETKWFERHGSTPITEIPAHWPESYRRLIERRLEVIASNPNIALIEQPEYKRRWNREPWDEQQERALRGWLLDRMENRDLWFGPEPRLQSAAQVADRLRQDADFRLVADLYRGRDDYDWGELISELAGCEAVPFLAPLRYAESGLRKRADWEATWALQRREDAIEGRVELQATDPLRLTMAEAKRMKALEVGEIPVPPKYAPGDFANGLYWRLRGKLDVPKERFILYPGAEREADPTPMLGWAGWSHLEQAQALGTSFYERREREGWGADRLAPLLAGLVELLPWLAQWHNEPDPAQGGLRMGDYFANFVDEEARSLGLTREALKNWRPAAKASKGGKKAKK